MRSGGRKRRTSRGTADLLPVRTDQPCLRRPPRARAAPLRVEAAAMDVLVLRAPDRQQRAAGGRQDRVPGRDRPSLLATEHGAGGRRAVAVGPGDGGGLTWSK